MRIVVGYDGSEQSERALRRAVEVAARRGGTVAVVSSASVTAPVGRGPGGAVVDPWEESARDEALASAARTVADAGVECRPVAGVGDAGKAIVEEAKEWGADLIVVGTRGRNLAQRLALGSVSTYVVHHAPCDVLVVR